MWSRWDWLLDFKKVLCLRDDLDFWVEELWFVLVLFFLLCLSGCWFGVKKVLFCLLKRIWSKWLMWVWWLIMGLIFICLLCFFLLGFCFDWVIFGDVFVVVEFFILWWCYLLLSFLCCYFLFNVLLWFIVMLNLFNVGIIMVVVVNL